MDISYVERGIADLLDKAKAQGRCVDWEIDELVPMGGKELGLKIGVYPWGKTIVYGTASQLLAIVRDILREIDENRFACPFCSARQPLDVTMRPEADCASCGARFFMRHPWADGKGVVGEDCWPTLRWALLHSGHGRRYKEVSEAVPLVEEHGAALEDVFDGALTNEVLGTVVHAVSPDAKPLTPDSQPFHVRATALLREAGFEEHAITVYEHGEYRDVCWFEGEVVGELVVVQVGHRLGDGILAIAIDEEPSRIYEAAQGNDEISFDLTDETSEAWCDWTLACNNENWQVCDGFGLDDIGSFPLSAYYKGPLPERLDAAWLMGTLEAGVRACTAAAQGFLDEFCPERRLGELKAAHEKAAFVREQALRRRLDAVVPKEHSAALVLYLEKVGTMEQRGWLDRDIVAMAMGSVAKELGAKAVADLAKSSAASLLWSKKLRKYVAGRWGQ